MRITIYAVGNPIKVCNYAAQSFFSIGELIEPKAIDNFTPKKLIELLNNGSVQFFSTQEEATEIAWKQSVEHKKNSDPKILIYSYPVFTVKLQISTSNKGFYVHEIVEAKILNDKETKQCSQLNNLRVIKLNHFPPKDYEPYMLLPFTKKPLRCHRNNFHGNYQKLLTIQTAWSFLLCESKGFKTTTPDKTYHFVKDLRRILCRHIIGENLPLTKLESYNGPRLFTLRLDPSFANKREEQTKQHSSKIRFLGKEAPNIDI